MPKDYWKRAKDTDIARAVDRAQTGNGVRPGGADEATVRRPSKAEEAEGLRWTKRVAESEAWRFALHTAGRPALEAHLTRISQLLDESVCRLPPGVKYYAWLHVTKWHQYLAVLKPASMWEPRATRCIPISGIDGTWADLVELAQKKRVLAKILTVTGKPLV